MDFFQTFLGTYQFYYSNGASSAASPTSNGQTYWQYNPGLGLGSTSAATYYANYSYGLAAFPANPSRQLQFYVYRYDSNGNDLNSYFNNLNTTGGTIMWEQNGVQAIYSGTGVNYSYGGSVLQFDISNVSQEILSATTLYTSATTINLRVI